MAGGKLSPRQRMINLMYLVFIAMLAMQVSPEILTGFGLANEKTVERNARLKESNQVAYETLAQKASEQAKQFGEAKQKTDSIKVLSNEFFNYIEDLKKQMTADVEDKTNYESMNKPDFLNELFFEGGKITTDGETFVNKFDSYRNDVVKILGKRPLAEEISKRFETNEVTDREGVKKSWLSYNYENHPLIGSISRLSQVQADIRGTESEALSALLQKELSDAVSMTNYDAMVIFDKSAYYPGQKLSGKIVLGKNDPNLVAEKVVINGKNWPKDKIKAGQVILDGPAGSVGDKTIKGMFTFMEDGKPVEIPITGGYSVIPKPNSAVVSADKMNVVYRGLPNPMTISVPGVASNKVRASAPGLRPVGGDKYTMSPQGGSSVTINVSATLPDGSKINTPKTYRIKDIPTAVGMVRGKGGIVKMPKSSAANVTVAAGLPDFLFDLKLQVLSFKVKAGSQLTVPVSGANLNGRAKQAIAKTRRGDQITFFDIKAKVTNSSYQIKEVAPVIVQVTN